MADRSQEGVPVTWSSRHSGWTDFDLDVLAEPSSETEMEGTSVNSSIPMPYPKQGKPDLRTKDLWSKMRAWKRPIAFKDSSGTRTLLDKAKGEYWENIKKELDHASSHREYNQLLDFESMDLQLQILELKHECLALFQQVLSRHPSLLYDCRKKPTILWTS